jgi:polyhydroxyalkanoate synthesis repressor PhaR
MACGVKRKMIPNEANGRLNMANEKQPITIKKYANRRLYNTGTSAYVTLEDLADMVKKGEDFVVFDAKSGEDITRSVLAQIIFEQEGKGGQSLLPIAFLRQLIRFYGDSMQMLVPSYLEFSIDKLTSEQNKFRDKMASGFGGGAIGPSFSSLEETARKNMALFNQALAMFSPFVSPLTPAPPGAPPKVEKIESEANTKNDIEEMKRQLEEMQKRIAGMAPKE